MSRNLFIFVVFFVALKHKHVLGEVVLRDVSEIHKIVIQPLARVLCPWQPLIKEENSKPENVSTKLSRASWCGTTEKAGGFCNAKCSDNIFDGYLLCAKEFKNNVKQFIDRMMSALCKNKEET